MVEHSTVDEKEQDKSAGKDDQSKQQDQYEKLGKNDYNDNKMTSRQSSAAGQSSFSEKVSDLGDDDHNEANVDEDKVILKKDDDKNNNHVSNEVNTDTNLSGQGVQDENKDIIKKDNGDDIDHKKDIRDEKIHNDQKEVAVENHPKEHNGLETGNNNQSSETNQDNSDQTVVKQKPRKRRKNIFVSYSLDAPYTERKLIYETVKQLKELGFHEDLWYDRDEIDIDSPICFATRMEQSERCKAAILFLSSSYFQSRASYYEYNTLIQRCRLTMEQKAGDIKPVKLCIAVCESFNLPDDINNLSNEQLILLRLDDTNMLRLSIAERASIAIGVLTKGLEPYCSGMATRLPTPPSRHGTTTEDYKRKKLLAWSVDDVQHWLASLQVHERYMMAFEEYRIDGYLLSCLTEDDLIKQLCVDSRVTRRKLLQKFRNILESEVKSPNNWYLKWHWARIRDNSVFIIYDPMDKKIARALMEDISRKHFQVLAHDRLGQSKEEFVRINGHRLAASRNVVVILTATASTSPFVYQEALLADWLGKTPITLVFQNCYNNTKLSLRSILNDRPAVDFQHARYTDALDVLFFQLSSGTHLHGVILQQDYIDRMNDNIKTLQSIALPDGQSHSHNREPVVFISYQWDSQSKALILKEQLEANGIPCWIDMPSMNFNKHQLTQTTSGGRTSGAGSSPAINNSNVSGGMVVTDTIQSEIQRAMKNCKVVICCMTPKYTRSDNFYKDFTLADSLAKPILPVMLHFMPWPPDIATSHIRKSLATLDCIDISNEKLFRRNFASIVNQIQRHQSRRMSIPKLPPLK